MVSVYGPVGEKLEQLQVRGQCAKRGATRAVREVGRHEGSVQSGAPRGQCAKWGATRAVCEEGRHEGSA